MAQSVSAIRYSSYSHGSVLYRLRVAGAWRWFCQQRQRKAVEGVQRKDYASRRGVDGCGGAEGPRRQLVFGHARNRPGAKLDEAAGARTVRSGREVRAALCAQLPILFLLSQTAMEWRTGR